MVSLAGDPVLSSLLALPVLRAQGYPQDPEFWCREGEEQPTPPRHSCAASLAQLLPRRVAKAGLTRPQLRGCSGEERSRGWAVPERYRLVLPPGKGMPLSEV